MVVRISWKSKREVEVKGKRQTQGRKIMEKGVNEKKKKKPQSDAAVSKCNVRSKGKIIETEYIGGRD